MRLPKFTVIVICFFSMASGLLLDDEVYPGMSIPDNYFMDEMYPFQNDFEEAEDTDDQNGWMVVNEGEISQILDRIEEAEQKEDEKERVNQEEGIISTEQIPVEMMREQDDAKSSTRTSTVPHFWTVQPLTRNEGIGEEVTKNFVTPEYTTRVTTTKPAEEDIVPKFGGEEIITNSDLSPLTSDSQ